VFVGRARELSDLERMLRMVRRPGGREDRGQAVLVRGRRRIGKSRLVEELVTRSGLPSVTFQAARHADARAELAGLMEAVSASSLPGAALAAGQSPATLTAALTLLAGALDSGSPSVVVIDEAPWLLEQFPGGAGELQRVWDRTMRRLPVLLVLIGSDISAMEQLAAPAAPFHGRATPMLIGPLTPRDVAGMTELPPFEAVDAFLITGGQPLVAQAWERGMSRKDFLTEQLATSLSPLVVSGTRVLDAEFTEASVARQVLTSIGGSGERTFGGIQNARSGALNADTLSRTLRMLEDRGVVASELPVSTRAGAKLRRYRIEDPALRFHLAFVEPALAEVDRGRGDLALARVRAGYKAWRGRAVEPVVREALCRLMPTADWGDVGAVGGWRPRNNVPEIDVVAADANPARRIAAVGTIKWRRAPVTRSEVAQLAADAAQVPGVVPTTPLVAICPGGAEDTSSLRAVWTAEGLLEAWPA
jgi:AAA+ ATPase superfamily predicted ATPase